MITLKRKSTDEILELSDRLDWVDEMTWSPVQQTVKHGTTGAMHLHLNTKQAGRLITLNGRETQAFITRTVCITLEQWAGKVGEQFDLTLRGQTYTVLFDHESGGFDAQPIWGGLLDSEYIGDSQQAADDWLYLPELRFITAPNAYMGEYPSSPPPAGTGNIRRTDW